jgi:sulfite exporter TauE/SafE
VAGIFILGMLLFTSIERFLTPKVSGNVHVLRQNLSRFIDQPRWITAFSTGLLNGLLPCGMVYMALAMAAAQGDALMGTYFMLAFGAGTIPAMLTVAYAGQFIRKMTPSWRIVQVSFFVVLAVLLIGRGFVSTDHQGHLLGNEEVTQCE